MINLCVIQSRGRREVNMQALLDNWFFIALILICIGIGMHSFGHGHGRHGKQERGSDPELKDGK